MGLLETTTTIHSIPNTKCLLLMQCIFIRDSAGTGTGTAAFPWLQFRARTTSHWSGLGKLLVPEVDHGKHFC